MNLREQRKKERRRKKILLFLKIFAVAALVIVLSVVAIIKFFVIKSIHITGNTYYTAETIQQSLQNDKYSDNTLYVLLKYRLWSKNSIPYLESLKVKFVSPTKLSATVEEKTIYGYVQQSQEDVAQNVYFDKEGLVVDISDAVYEEIPLITGLTYNTVTEYKVLPVEDEEVFQTLLSLSQTLKKYELVPQSIDFGSTSEITLTYGSIQVLLGKATNLNEKIVNLDKIMPELDGMSGTLHMENWTEETTEITFQKTNE